MKEMLYRVCEFNVAILDGWHPVSSTLLSGLCGLSLYQTRKELKRLKECGLIESCVEVIVDEDGNTILRGYRITEKGKLTEEYKKAYEEERERCFGSFGIDIGSYESEIKNGVMKNEDIGRMLWV